MSHRPAVDGVLQVHHLGAMTTSPQPETDVGGLVDEVAQHCLMTRTRRISRVVTGIYDQALRPFGINAPQFSLLVLIARMDGASRAEIGRANFQERSTLTRNLALLLSEGWVEERTPQAKGRSRPIFISKAGRDLLAAAMPAWRSAQAKAKQLLGAAGAVALVGLADGLPPDELAG